MNSTIFKGVLPALMTPCKADRTPDFDALIRKGKQLIAEGMSGVVYCGSMGDWPLLTDEQRMHGVECLVKAGIPVVVGTGAVNTATAVTHAKHAQQVGAKGLMIIPRLLSRANVISAQKDHFSAVLAAAPDLPAVIYNSPYYGFTTRADLFFALREKHKNLIGYKEFGGSADMTYAAETITNSDDTILLLIGIDTTVVHGFVNCGAVGAITGIGNVLPKEVLHLCNLSRAAAKGDVEARLRAHELEDALAVLSSFDAGPDLVLYFKYLMVLKGDAEYSLHFNEADCLTPSQRNHAKQQFQLFNVWYAMWSKISGAIQTYKP